MSLYPTQVESHERAPTPIAIFVYNRPEYAWKLFRSLESCKRLEECCVHIYCDGAKDEGDARAVCDARRAALHWGEVHGAKIVMRERNLGLARSIVSGVEEMCAVYGQVIVLEDDLVVSPDFIHYMLEGLDRYREHHEVMQISAHSTVDAADLCDAYFMQRVSSHGWATWKRSWDSFSWDAHDAVVMLKDADARRRFNLDNSYPYTQMIEDRMDGLNDSWAILWWWVVFKAGGLVLYPARSLVWVGGYDNSGTHCSTITRPIQDDCQLYRADRLQVTLRYPAQIDVHREVESRVQSYLRKQMKTRWRLLLPKSVRRRSSHMLRAAIRGWSDVRRLNRT